MLPMASQILASVAMIAIGVLTGLMFDIYRVFRFLLRPGATVSIFLDLIFWVLATPVIFLLLLACNWGQLRLYVFLGMAVGLFSYFQLLSQSVLWFLLNAVRRVTSRVAAMVYAVVRAASWPANICRDIRCRWGRRSPKTRRWFVLPPRGAMWGHVWPFFRR